jgi:hypothetical protein
MGTPAMKKFLPAVALSVSIFAMALFALSRAHAWGVPHKGTTKNESYMVIKIIDENKTDDARGGGANNKIQFKVISASQYKDEEKRVNDDNATKLKEWKDLIKTDPQTPRPIKITIKKIKTGYQTQKIAQEYCDKLRDEAEGKVKPNGRN